MSLGLLLALWGWSASQHCIPAKSFRKQFGKSLIRDAQSSKFSSSPTTRLQPYFYKGNPVVRKYFALASDENAEGEEPEDVLREIEILELLSGNKGVVRYFCCEADQTFVGIFMEQLWDNLFKQQAHFQARPWAEKFALLIPPTMAFHAMHQLKFIHGDIKTPNLMYTFEADALKVIDFGGAVAFGEPCPVYTPFYVAPELARERETPAHPSQDVWSWAVSLFELLLPSFELKLILANQGQEVDVITPELVRTARYRLLKESVRFGLPLYPVMVSWLVSDPARRPSMLQIAKGLNKLFLIAREKEENDRWRAKRLKRLRRGSTGSPRVSLLPKSALRRRRTQGSRLNSSREW